MQHTNPAGFNFISKLEQIVHGLAELGRPPGKIPGGRLVGAVGRICKVDQGLAYGPEIIQLYLVFRD